MKQALQNMAEVLGSVEDRPERNMRFSPSVDEENTMVWRDLENVRYTREGVREDITVRGGSEQVDLGSALNGNIITEYGFTSAFGTTTDDFIIIHTNQGYLYLFNDSTSTLTDFGDGHGFNSSTPLQVIINGRFAYLFDSVNEIGRYVDLSDMEVYDWLGAEAPSFQGEITEITSGDITKENIMGFEKGASIYIQNTDHYWNPPDETLSYYQNTYGDLPPGVYEYHYNDGNFITIDGIDYQNNELFIFTEHTPFSINGSGDDATISASGKSIIPFKDGNIDYSGQITTINDVGDLFSGQPGENELDYKVPWDGGFDTLSGGSALGSPIILPGGSDISGIEDYPVPYRVENSTLEENTSYTTPILYKSYVALFELKDGSFSLLSHPHIATTNPYDHFRGNVGGDLDFFGFDISINSDIPSGAVKLHLFSTRWQLTREATVSPSDKYPDGPFFYVNSFPPDVGTIEDRTPDKKLLRPLSEFVPTANGIANYFGANQISPKYVDGHKGGVLYGGYRIDRPVIEAGIEQTHSIDEYYKITVTQTGGDPAVTDHFFEFAYEYPDGTLGRWISQDAQGNDLQVYEDSRIFIKPPNALVSAVHIYIRDDSDDPPDYLFVDRLTSADPEYFGTRMDIGDVSNYPEQPRPNGSMDNEAVRLENYIAYGTPPQLIQIDSQNPNESGERIKGIEILRVDDERSSSIRYQAALFTEAYPELFYFDASLQGSDLLFQADFEPYGLASGFGGHQTVLRHQKTIFFEGYKGIYELTSRQVDLVVSRERYPEIANGILSTSMNPYENEAWFLLNDNRCMVIDLDRTIEPPLFMMQYPTDGDTMRQITAIDKRLFAGVAGRVLRLDNQSLIEDRDFGTAEPVAVHGVLTSDHLSSFYQQLYLDVIELLGQHYRAKVEVDLQEARFDNSPDAWQSAFNADIDTGFYDLDMKGIVLELFARGVSPRIRLTVEPESPGRLAAGTLYFEPVEHEGATRR